jgi:PERQ amino acid-rich with GYF domain-containing protein
LISEKDAFYDEVMFSSGGTSPPKGFKEENTHENQSGLLNIQEGFTIAGVKSSTHHDLTTKLPDDSNILFDVPSFEHPPEPPMPHHSNDMDIKASGQASCPEELTMYYLDPQGGVQGPFLGADIISWYEDGYFGLELPVRLSQAPDDAPFRPLVEVMPHLGHKPQPHPAIPSDESAGSIQNKFEAVMATSASSGKSDQVPKWDSESHVVDPKRSEQEVLVQSQRIPEAVNQDTEGWFPLLVIFFVCLCCCIRYILISSYL